MPQILGVDLNKAGKLPSLLTQNKNMVAKVDEVKSRVVVAGHMRMTDEIVYDIYFTVNFLVSLINKNWQNFLQAWTLRAPSANLSIYTKAQCTKY